MGQYCNCGCCGSKGGEAFNPLTLDEKELDFKYQKSTNDKYVLKLEINQNLFAFITLIEFYKYVRKFFSRNSNFTF